MSKEKTSHEIQGDLLAAYKNCGHPNITFLFDPRSVHNTSDTELQKQVSVFIEDIISHTKTGNSEFISNKISELNLM